MSIYSKIQKADLAQILLPYNIETTDFSPITEGNANSNFTLKMGDDEYILTIMEEKTIAEAQVLANLLRWLNEHKYPTNRLLAARNGELITVYKEKPVLVKRRVTGNIHKDLSEDMLSQLGQSMARLHEIQPPVNLPQSHPYQSNIFSKVIDKGLDREYEVWLEQRLDYFNKNLPKNMPRGLIHGDLFFDNVLFENGRLKAVIDFEEACNYFLILDLAMGVLGLCCTKEQIESLKIRALVKGYEKVRLLDPLEKLSLPLFIEYAAVATSCWRFWKYHIDSPSVGRQKKHLEMVRMSETASQLQAEICFD